MGATDQREEPHAAAITRPLAGITVAPLAEGAAYDGPDEDVTAGGGLRSCDWSLVAGAQAIYGVPAPAARWWRAGLHIFRGVCVAVEVALIVLLAAYAGLVHILPSAPPVLRVQAGGQHVLASAGSYCWLTPGHGDCMDQVAPTSLASLPQVTVRQGAALRFSVAYPAPTQCVAASTAQPVGVASTAQVLGTLARHADASSTDSVSYQLGVTLRPGSYVLTVACHWDPFASLRWLRGQGQSDYAVALRVVAHLA